MQQQPKETCTCPAKPAGMNELCIPCASEWNAWLEEDLRQARVYAVYGATEREAA